MFYVKIFKNTGYNLVNVPDSIETLMSLYTGRDYPVIDTLQLFHNTNIKLKVPGGESEIQTADFLLLSKNQQFNPRLHPAEPCEVAAYVINSYEMTSGDTVVLNVSMEPFITCGGKNIDFLDGMVSRRHVTREEDYFGAFVEDDPLLVPSASPKIKFRGQQFVPEDPSQGITDDTCAIVQTAFDLPMYGMNDWIKIDSNLVISNDGNLIDGVTGDMGHIIFPGFQSHPFQSKVIPDHNAGFTRTQNKPLTTNPIEAFSAYTAYGNGVSHHGNNMNDFIEEKIKPLYEYGITDFIKNAYMIPGYWAHFGLDISHIGTGVDSMPIEIIEAHVLKTVTDIPLIWAAESGNEFHNTLDQMNRRVWYGRHNQLIFVATANGNCVAKQPETLYRLGSKGTALSILSDENTPVQDVITMPGNARVNDPDLRVMLYGWCDPRATGGVKFHIVTKDDEFVNNSVGPYVWSDGFAFKEVMDGGKWSSVNMSMTAIQGGRLNQINYNQNRKLQDFNTIVDAQAALGYSDFEMKHPFLSRLGDDEFNSAVVRIGNQFGNEAAALREQTAFNKYGIGGVDAFGINNGELTQKWSEGSLVGNASATAYLKREAQAKAEAIQYLTSNVPKPIILFEGSADADPSSNAILVYQMIPDPKDVVKYNKVLNQFGYKVTEPIKAQFMSNRPSYNYILATGVSIGHTQNNVPMSVRDDCATAFTQGLRIWHIKPNASLYAQADGGNVEEEVNNNV